MGQNGPGSNDNEEVLHIPQIFKAEALPSDSLISYPGHSLVRGLSLCRDAVSVFHPQPTGLIYFGLSTERQKEKYILIIWV